MHGNICKRWFMRCDENGFHRVYFLTQSGALLISQVPYVRRIDAERHGQHYEGKVVPASARQA